MILRILHSIAAHSVVYDWIQSVVGAKEVYSRMARHVPGKSANSYVLDLGGGTGTIRQYWPSKCRYICLDLDRHKLSGFVKKAPGNIAVQGDAARLPLTNDSMDVVVCTLVSHHLPEEALSCAAKECWRVLKPGGAFIFADALRRPDRWLSRFMWSLDRGAHPHDIERLEDLLSNRFQTTHTERFTVYHEYVLMVLQKSAGPQVSQK
jgi:ubiquinone/menaquinone biosynthesis C-methylase UbiE